MLSSILLCKFQRQLNTKTWCILWIYMNISYIIFIWSCFSSCVKHTRCFLHFTFSSWRAVWGEIFFCTCDNQFAGCVSLTLVFSMALFLTRILSNLIRWHYGLYTGCTELFFPPSHVLQALNVMEVNFYTEYMQLAWKLDQSASFCWFALANGSAPNRLSAQTEFLRPAADVWRSFKSMITTLLNRSGHFL